METTPYDKDPVPDYDAFYRQYCETVHGLDENIGRILDHVQDSGLAESTLVVYTSDNGFALGEHGFYDKRDAFEESIRVPMLAYAPGLIRPGTKIDQMVMNLDVAPTMLELAEAKPDAEVKMDGRSFLPLLKGQDVGWRDHILYEYHWEWNFPATPTLFAIRGQRFKFIFYHGVWDHNGFYDLKTDPHERHNLINVPAYKEQIAAMQKKLFDEMESRNALVLPVRRPAGARLDDRKLP